MRLISNISMTKRALATLREQRSRTHRRADDVLGLVYIEFFREADGQTVKGFVPGYMASAWQRKYLSDDWLRARLADGVEFYLRPKFGWSADENYLMDDVGGPYALFSIRPR